MNNPNENIINTDLTNEEANSIVSAEKTNVGITREELDAKNKTFLDKKKKEVEVIVDMYRERKLEISPKLINQVIYSVNAGRLDSIRGMHITMQALQPDLYAYFNGIYNDIPFDLRSDYKDLEYLWINVESLIRGAIANKRVTEYESIIETFIPDMNALSAFLTYHESDSKDDFEDERHEYREEHGFEPRI